MSGVNKFFADIGQSIETAAKTTNYNLNYGIGKKVEQVTKPRKGTAAAQVNVGGSTSTSVKFGEGGDRQAAPALPPEYGKTTPKPTPIDGPYYAPDDPRKAGQNPYAPPPFTMGEDKSFDPALEQLLQPRPAAKPAEVAANTILDYTNGYGYSTISPFATTVNKKAYNKFKTERGL